MSRPCVLLATGWLFLLLPALLGGLAPDARAQAPTWAGANVGSISPVCGTSVMTAAAPDASGNMLVTGYFSGTIALGGKLLTSAGDHDLFVAKWVPATGTWAWASSGGGTGADSGSGLAVSGSAIYVVGSSTNNTANANRVAFGGTGPATATYALAGATATASLDLVLLKYTDNGTSVTPVWGQVGDGRAGDSGSAVAVSGSSVYVTGQLANNLADDRGSVFGGSGTTAGTVPVRGATATVSSDLLLLKYTDSGSTAALGWAQVGGGEREEVGYGVAVSGSSVYVTGYLTNSLANDYRVVFGGNGTTAGTVQVNGASSLAGADLLLVKYQDNGSSATLGWTQVAGGLSYDAGAAVAVSNNAVYVTGGLTNNRANLNSVTFGGSGTTAGTSPQYGASTTLSRDLLLARYTDNGPTATFNWSQVGGGADGDGGSRLAVSGSTVYVAGSLRNNVANDRGATFGNAGTSAGTVAVAGATSVVSDDWLLARYTVSATGATLDWAKTGGGTGDERASDVVLAGQDLLVAGSVDTGTAYTFGQATTTDLPGTFDSRAAVAKVDGATGAWGSVTPVFNGGFGRVEATAADGRGNVFVTGSFAGQLRLGNTLLVAAGDYDLFVAKYVPATDTWAWAQRGGGRGGDGGYGLAVSGTSVYVTGSFYNDRANTRQVLFGGTTPAGSPSPLSGASATASDDLLLVKYEDQGSSGRYVWSQVGRGSSYDYGQGVAVSGTSVYVSGALANTTANAQGVTLGGTGTTAGTVQVNGASATNSIDLLLVKYQDNGSSASYVWNQVGGGTEYDCGNAVAVNGTSVYVTGSLVNDAANSQGVLLGGTGTTAGTVRQYGASATASYDLLLAKYQDNGPTATLSWSQVGGGTGNDSGNGVVVKGTSVYVVGGLYNSTTNASGVLFGGSGTVAGTVQVNGATATSSLDLVLARYQDNGSTAVLAWTQVGGGIGSDYGSGLAVSGTSIYVAGTLYNTASNSQAAVFGGGGTTAGTVAVPGAATRLGNNVVVARYTDSPGSGALDWVRVGGGSGADEAYDLTLSGQQVILGGQTSGGAVYGPTTIPNAALTNGGLLAQPVVARLTDTTLQPLPTRSAGEAGRLALYPNPAPGAAILVGAAAGAAVQVLDALGGLAATATADAGGTARVSGLAPGLYLVRAGAATARLAVP